MTNLPNIWTQPSRKILACILLLLPGILLGQTRFNRRVSIDFPTTVLTSVIEGDSGYFVTGVAADSINPAITSSVFLEFDIDGYLLNQNTLIGPDDQDLLSWNPDLAFENDSVLIYSGGTTDQAGTMQSYFAYHHTSGDTIVLNRFYRPGYPTGFSDFFTMLSSSVASDGNVFVLCGLFNPDTGNDRILQKRTPTGDLMWTYTFATDQDPDICHTIYPTPNGGCWLFPKIVGEIQANAYHHIIRLDLAGNESENHVTDFGYWSGSFKDVIVDDNHFIAVSSFLGPEGSHVIPGLLKISMSGDLVWHTPSWEDDAAWFNTGRQVVKAPNEEGYVMGGNHIETVVNPTDTTGDENQNAFLTKYSLDGEVLWHRRYHYLNVPDDRHELYDLKATSDGGYIFCGQATDLVPFWEFSEPPYQQGWLVKVDGFGCLVEGCELFDSVEEIRDPEGHFFLAGPNPTSDFINLYPTHQLPLSSSFNLYTLNGQHKDRFDASFGNGTTLMLDLTIYPKGTYLLQLEDKGKVLEQVKVVVQ